MHFSGIIQKGGLRNENSSQHKLDILGLTILIPGLNTPSSVIDRSSSTGKHRHILSTFATDFRKYHLR